MTARFFDKTLRDGVAILATNVFIVVSLLFLLVPIAATLIMSFDSREYIGYWPPPGYSTRWYERFWSSPIFISGLVMSLKLACLSSVISVVVGMLIANALVRYDFPGKHALNSVLLSPLVVPGIVTGFSMLGFFSLVGIRETFLRLLIAHVIITIPFAVKSIQATLLGVDRALEEAAMSLGANPLTTFFKVTLPLTKPGIVAGSMFAFAASIDDVAVSIFLIDPFTSTLPVNLFSYMRSEYTPLIAAASGILMVFTVATMLAIEKITGLDRMIGIVNAVPLAPKQK